MHSRNGDGWGGILGHEEVEEADRTDPNLEMPAFGDVGSEEETRIAHMPPTPPGKKPKKLVLPRHESGPREASPPPAVEFPVQVDELVQKLEAPAEKRASGSRVKAKKHEGSLFTKEVVLTIVGGFVLLGGTLAYTRSSSDEAPAPPETKVLSMDAVKPELPKPPPPVVEKPPEPQVAKEETARKTTTPLLSILSSPSGARVEIDGTIYGSTPLIQPSPPNVKSLSIRLLKDNYRPYETILTPNESGHFNLNATLEKR